MDYTKGNYKMSKTATGATAIEIIAKWMPIFGYVIIGLIGKFGYDIVSKKKITFWYIVGTSAIALFIGFLSAKMCDAHPLVNPGIAIPVATLLSRDLIVFITMIDKKKLMELLFNIKSTDKK